MCIFTTMAVSTGAAIAVAAAAALSGAVTAGVTLSNISAQKKAAAYQIEQKKKEAKNAEMEAAYERQEGVEEARRQKMKSILSMADEKTKLAGSNIALTSGLVLNLENDNKLNSTLEALSTQKNAERRAAQYMNRRNSLYENARLISYNSRRNASNSYLQLGRGWLNNFSSTIS